VRSRWAAAAGSAVFFVIAPATIAGFVPRWLTRWHMSQPLFGWTAIRWIGAGLIAVGAAVVLESFARFVIRGFGTPAPVAPPQRLVVTGLYRHVRNPMYVGVTAAIVGQALLLGATSLLFYAAFVALTFHLWVLGYEEPALRARFGAEYEEYCRRVRRWWPRLTPR
jgi:protein-S-isoprenylcysteine O-methyltransferase Ste14